MSGAPAGPKEALPAPHDPPLLTTPESLAEFCAAAREAREVALDTEFVWERTYAPRLGIVQLATPSTAAIADLVAIPSPAPLWDLLGDPSVEVVVHAGKTDLQILTARGAPLPARIFDTQVAAAVAGYGDSIGYGRLVERLLRVVLPKFETRTDWTKRPLTPQQVTYALDDVRYLFPVRRRIRERLAARRRDAWLDEELGRMRADLAAPAVPDTERYRAVRRRGRLTPRDMALLQALTAWREGAARTRDLPREWVARDEWLVEIARRAPRSPEALSQVPGLPPRERERSERAILEAVRQGLAAPEIVAASAPGAPEREGPDDAVADLLMTIVRARARRANVAAVVVATRADVAALITHHRGGTEGSVRLLEGWRRELVGDALVGFLRGESAIRIDPATCEPDLV